MQQAVAEHIRTPSGSQNPHLSTEMRDTARLVNGRVVYDRAVIMARAWKIARNEFAAYAAMGAASRHPLMQCFAEALKQSWADAKAMAWKLSPPALTERQVLAIEIMGLEGTERPSDFDLQRLAELRRQLATLPAVA